MTPAAYILVGPTASGKSAVAECLAAKSSPPAPIVAADSMTVYAGMDLGTAKPDAASRARTPVYGLDLCPPSRDFSVGDYLAAIRALWPEIARSPSLPIVAGGTGLYVKCLTEGLDAPAVASPVHRQTAEALLAEQGPDALLAAVRALAPAQFSRIRDPQNPRRLVRAYELLASGHELPLPVAKKRPKVVGLRLPPDELDRRIERRARRMFAYGLVDEVRSLRAQGPLSETARHAIGYEEAAAVLDGALDEEAAIALTARRTRRYAKRQMTWFRHQADVAWVDVDPEDSVERIAGRVQRLWKAQGPAPLAL